MPTVGDIDSQAAVFVYKTDATRQSAWRVVRTINQEHGGIRGELHNDPNELLRGLEAWSAAVDPTNAFLCVYAHMGALGINCLGGQASTRVTWSQFATAITQPVELLWLVGCKSRLCLPHWGPLGRPVRHLLLATSASQPFLPLVRLFAAEIDIDHIRFYDEMPAYLREAEPQLGRCTQYYRPSANGFVPAFGE